jgi:hypothetical protein
MQAVVAYLDPGTGSMLLQLILGGVAAAVVGLRLFWRRVLDILRIGRRPEGEPEPRAPH